jgi:hypothetical protein
MSEFQTPAYIPLRAIRVSEFQTAPLYILLSAIWVSEFQTPLNFTFRHHQTVARRYGFMFLYNIRSAMNTYNISCLKPHINYPAHI